jgi:PBP1b-binding outer membrane lipoprotein LpoB
MGAKFFGLVAAAVLAVFLAGCSSNEDKYVVQTPVPPTPQQGQGTGH